MYKIKFLTFLFLGCLKSYSQDTIYSYYFPNGIVTKTLMNVRENFRLTPINNPNLTITISKESTRKIHFENGKKYINPNPINYIEDEVVMLTDPLTGKIYYNEVMEFPGTKKKDLFNAVKTIPQGVVSYFLITSDEEEYDFQKYVGRMPVVFAGDPYVLYFNLLVKFKESKVKYEYSDFVATFSETKSKQSANIIDAFSNGVNTATKEHMIVLDVLYGKANRSDVKKFWKPIFQYFNGSISSLKKICHEAASDSKDEW